LIVKGSGADAGFGVAIETTVPVHDAPDVVSVLVKPLNTLLPGSEDASQPLLMLV
jgi:hypothetical protein